MNLSKKLFLFFFLSLGSTILSLYLLSSQVFLEGFGTIEKDLTEQNVQRVREAFWDELEHLQSISAAYGWWDDTYEFAQKMNRSYIANNYETPTIFDSNFSQVLIFGADGEILFSKGFKNKEKRHFKIEDQQIRLVQDQLKLKETKGSFEKVSGFLIGEGSKAYMISAIPILPSSGQGPSRGIFVSLREVSDHTLQRIQNILKVNFSLTVGPLSEWSDDVIKKGYILQGSQTLQGLVVFPDVSQSKAIIARLDFTRAIYQLGQKTVFSYMITVGFFLVITFGIIFIVFHKDFLARLLRLKEQLKSIDLGAGERLKLNGKDEIARLGDRINSMLDRIDSSQMMANRASKFSALGEMAGSIAHEINNPLAIIAGFCTRLVRMADKKDLDPQQIKETAHRILATSSRIEKIVKSLKLVSRDGERDAKDEVQLGEVLDEVVALVENKLQQENIQLRLSNFDRHQKVHVRFVQVVQVLLNLIGNSIDAIVGQSDKWIEIRTEFDGKMVNLYIIDSGIGIDEEIAEKIMTPFFTTKDIGKGTGLGLSISKGIIEAHHGSFELVSSSENTMFKISLPR